MIRMVFLALTLDIVSSDLLVIPFQVLQFTLLMHHKPIFFGTNVGAVNLTGSSFYDIIAENGFALTSVYGDDTTTFVDCENLQFISNNLEDGIDGTLKSSILINSNISQAYNINLEQCGTRNLSLKGANLLNFHITEGSHTNLSLDNANIYPTNAELLYSPLFLHNVEDVSGISFANLNQAMNENQPEGDILPATLVLEGENNLTGAIFDDAYLALEPAQVQTTTWTGSSFMNTQLVSTTIIEFPMDIMTGYEIADFLGDNGVPAVEDGMPVEGSELASITFVAPANTAENVSAKRDEQTRVSGQSVFKRSRTEEKLEQDASNRQDKDQDNSGKRFK